MTSSSQPAAAPRPGVNLPLLVAVHVLFALTGMAATAPGALLPILLPLWGLRDAPGAALIAVTYGGSALAAVFAPALIFRAGFRRALLAAATCIAAGMLLLVFVGWPMALAALFVAGVGVGLAIPASNLLVAQLSGQRAPAMLNLVNSAWVIGAVAGPVILKALHQNEAAFLAVIIVPTVVSGATLLTIRVPQAQRSQASAEDQSAAHVRSSEVALFVALFFLYIGVEAAMFSWAGELTRRSQGWAQSFWPYAPSLFWGTILIGRAIAFFLLRKSAAPKLLRAGLFIAIAGMALMLTRGLRPGIAFAGLGLACVFPLLMALFSQELRIGRVTQKPAGIVFMAAPFGGVLGPLLVGAISDRTASLQIGMTLPLVATVAMFGLYELLLRSVNSQGPTVSRGLGGT
jgi:FHS family glucose/mannose:H+ symporter-like MFS transporter